MKRKRHNFKSKPRAELITGFAYGTSAALAEAASPPPASSEGGAEEIACPSCEAMNEADAKFCDQCGAEMPEAEAVAETDAAAVVPVPPTEVDGGDAPTVDPVDEDGNVAAGAICATVDCGHLASEHANVEGGDNSGPCTTCECAAMQVDVAPNPSPDQTTEAEAAKLAAGAAHADVAVPAPEAPSEPAASSLAETEQNAPPEVEGGDSMGPAFTIPVVIIEGQPTTDGRQIAIDALTWRTPPVPLMGLATETHDPEGWDLNDPAVICGRIDSFERVPGEGTTMVILARGFYLPNEDGMYFAELNEAMGRLGVSADVAVQASEITIEEIDEDGWPMDMNEILTEGTIMGATVCPYPAFEGAYIVLGDGEDQPDAVAIPQQADAPEVPPTPPAAVVAGGQLIHFMTYEQCEPCNQGLEVIVASGAGPTRPPKAWFSNPNFEVGDGRLEEILDRRGQRVVGGKYACPITVSDDGRVFGHIAPWDICHTGTSGQCIIAPHSAADYAHFKRGQHIVTAEGDRIRVGVLTADTGHASTRPGVSAAQAMAHYDNTALAAADVNIGEDEHGIWVAGAIRPDATEEQIRKLCASSISGDWRAVGGQLELVAALAVNQPGFPLAVVAAGQIESLVAAGSGVMHRLKHPLESAPHGEDHVLRAALAPMLTEAKVRANERIAALGT